MIGRRSLAALPLAALVKPRKKENPVGWASSIFPLLQFYSAPGTPTGEFGYSPTPGPGNLVYSNTFATQDPYGNITIPAGPAVYNNGGNAALQLVGNSVVSYSGTLSTGWTILNSLSSTTNHQFQQLPQADQNVYDTANLTFMAAGQTVNSLTAAAVTPSANGGYQSTINLAALATYKVRGMIVVEQGTVAANQGVRFGGTATMQNMAVGWHCTEGAAIFNSGVANGIGVDMSTGAVPANTTGELKFEGTLLVLAAGTLQLQARCITAAADTWQVGSGSYFDLFPVGVS